jgi:sec-independent protein translocase protein TatC
MVRRLAVVLVVMAIVSAVVFPFADRLINFLWYSFLPGSPTECAANAVTAVTGNVTQLNGTVDGTIRTVFNGTVDGRFRGTLNGTVANLSAVNTTGTNVTVNATSGLVNGTVDGVVRTAVDGRLNGSFNGTLQGAATNFTITNASNGTTGAAACPRLYHPLSLVLARLKVASLTGFVVALPVFVYESYRFMRPGLYPNERRYYLSSVPTSLVLAGIGIAFAYFLVLPVIFSYFLGYTQGAANVAFGLADTFDLILLMVGMFAFIFQIPLFVMLATMMGVASRRWLEDRRLYFWAGFAGIAFLFSPDPTGMAPFIVAVTMILLFEGTLLLLRWTGR